MLSHMDEKDSIQSEGRSAFRYLLYLYFHELQGNGLIAVAGGTFLSRLYRGCLPYTGRQVPRNDWNVPPTTYRTAIDNLGQNVYTYV